MYNYPTGTEWYERHKHERRLYDYCARCGREDLKVDLVTLCVRDPVTQRHRILTRVCADCYSTLLDRLGVAE